MGSDRSRYCKKTPSCDGQRKNTEEEGREEILSLRKGKRKGRVLRRVKRESLSSSHLVENKEV